MKRSQQQGTRRRGAGLWGRALPALLAAALACAACQPSPPGDIVPQKDQQAMLEQAASGGAAGGTDAPETLTVDISRDGGALRIHGTAQVAVLGDGHFPVLRVSPGEFDQALVDRAIDALLPDAALYDVVTVETKADIAAQIEQLQLDKPYYEEAGALDSYEQALAQLQQLLADAPEAAPAQRSDCRLRTMYEQATGAAFPYTGLSVGDAAQAGQRARYLTVANDTAQQEMYVTEYPDGGAAYTPATRGALLSYYDDREGKISGRVQRGSVLVTGEAAVPEAAAGILETAPQQAEQAAAALLDALGVEAEIFDVLLVASSVIREDGSFSDAPDAYHYRVCCTPSNGGAPNLYFRKTLLRGGDSFADIWGQWVYEQITVELDDAGVIRFNWSGPTRVEETLVEEAQLLPFSEISGLLETLMPAACTPAADPANPVESADIELTDAVLGLQRIAEQDSISSGLLTPLWCFYGVVTSTYRDGTVETRDARLDGAPLFVLNAVDGTVVDLERGY